LTVARTIRKTSASDLAVLGGTPAFTAPLHVGRPNVGNTEAFLARVKDILDREWLTNNGPYVTEFEEKIAELAGTKHCVAMANGTVALEIATRALGLRGEVIVPAFTFVATAHALMWQGIRPVFCEIDKRTHHIDPDAVDALINQHTSGILGVHLWGRGCRVDALAAVARRHGVPLMFDACHALGATWGGKAIGGFGRCEVFSFHATKFLNTLEGGAVVTDDAELAEKMRLMRNFGFAGEDRVVHLGTNGKMNEISAAMGLTLLEDRENLQRINEHNYLAYREELAAIPGVELLEYPAGERYNYQYIVLTIDENVFGLTRDETITVLRAENVLARRYFYPGCHRMKPYSAMHEYAHVRLPVTDDVARRVVVLPTGPQVDPEGIARIGDVLRQAARHAPRVAAQLRQ